MPRSYTQISTSIAGDPDWRELSRDAQWLFGTILVGPKIDLAGVQDWRPAKLAKRAGGTTAAEVVAIAKELVEKRYIFIDEETEEVLVRTFVRHDGVLKGPKTAIGLRNALADIGSDKLRREVYIEIYRAHRADPSLSGLSKLEDAVAMGERYHSEYPTVKASDTLSDGVPDTLSDTLLDGVSNKVSDGVSDGHPLLDPRSLKSGTAPADAVAPPAKGTRLPADWTPPASVVAWAASKYPSLDPQHTLDTFRDYWTSVAGAKGSKTDWVATYRNWVRREDSFAGGKGAAQRGELPDEWKAAAKPYRFHDED